MRVLLVAMAVLVASAAAAADIETLHRRLAAVCPTLVGVAMPSLDRTTWRIDHAAGTAAQQKTDCDAAAASIIASFDVNAPDVPAQVSSMQAKVALSRAGLLPAVQTWIASQDAETQLIWATAPSFSRSSALMATAAAALGITQPQLDALFVAAAAIQP